MVASRPVVRRAVHCGRAGGAQRWHTVMLERVVVCSHCFNMYNIAKVSWVKLEISLCCPSEPRCRPGCRPGANIAYLGELFDKHGSHASSSTRPSLWEASDTIPRFTSFVDDHTALTPECIVSQAQLKALKTYLTQRLTSRDF